MYSPSISSGCSSKIRNDDQSLDRFSIQLVALQFGLKTHIKQMLENLENLNNNGFADKNFKNLYEVLKNNTENVEKICSIMENLQKHIDELSLLIKEYYHIEI